MASTTERVKVKLPDGFDASKHEKALAKKIADVHGDGFEIDSLEDGYAIATRQVAITEVSHDLGSKKKDVRLPKSVKPSDGDKMAVKLADQHGDGWEMTKFEPFLGRATLTQLTPEVARCRGASAMALGVKPWEVQVKQRPDGGFDLELPKSYMPSKHDSKLEEVATGVVGYEGWYVKVNAQKLTASIIPSDPPTFAAAYPYPFGTKVPKFALNTTDWAKIPMGMKLPARGEETGEVFSLDLIAGSHLQIGGISGGGKTVLINAYIAGWLARGAELVVVDLPSKSVDFLWCKDFVRDGGWGCDNLKASVTALSLVMAEGDRRAKIIGQYGVQKWTELPPSVDMKPIVVVVDELTGLFFPEKVPKLAKDHPLVVEANEINLQKALLEKFIKRIAAELRFTGVHLLVASQVASVATGIDPAMRTNLHHKILMGAKPTEGNRRLVLSDPGRVPAVPDNVKADGKASRGSGVAEPEGDEPCVFKSFFATAEDYANWLRGRGVRVSSRPAPTAAEIAKHTPSLEDEQDTTAARRAAMPDPGAHLYGDAGLDENGRPLKGAALAAAQSRALAGHGGRA
jgi:hypothetical protein